MTAYEKLKTARQSDRPTAVAYIGALFDEVVELHGDRRFGDDAAIVGGLAFFDGRPVTYIGIEKGHDIQSRMKRNFGCPKPEGYRKALRLMKQAEKFGRPVICFVDTLGAFCGADAEERGQGQAIAENLMEMMGLRTPVITLVIGEGGSGGALALACANRVYMLENSVYSVITPEGCASIIWKDADRVADAAENLHITAEDMVRFGVAETVIPEDFAHFKKMCQGIRKSLDADLRELCALSPEGLAEDRYRRFRRLGHFVEG
ncbi:MAG: acetyl-CoA carboxylase carboxyltransferase subunit alpha [Clostridiales bacterium]|nr:acetyl-CoA carboxylase carboxyltransferase subunit alpha [Clostridiales bacterium]